MTTPETHLARHAAGLGWAAVPEATRARVRALTLDMAACWLAGLRSPACRALADRAVARGGAAEASIVGLTARVPAPAAAFVNAALAHWYEMDDVHDPGALHLSAVILPVLFAAAEGAGQTRAEDWPEVAAAMVAGFDVAGRIGEAIIPWTSSAWMPTGLACTIGAAAAAARILGLGEAGILSAMGLAAAGGGLLRQPLIDKVDGKNALCAQAATRAMEAVELAAAGITGAPRFLTGDFGLNRVFAAGRADLLPGLADLGSRFAIDELSLKPYPCCRSAHPAIDLALDLKAEAGIEADAVDTIEVRVPTPMFEMCGAPFAPGSNPRVSAQFSIPYTVAVALTGGAPRLDDFEAARVQAPGAVHALAAKVTTVAEPLAPGQRPIGAPVTMRIRSRSGAAVERTTALVKGSPARPMTGAELDGKFGDAAAGCLDDRGAAALRAVLADLDRTGLTGLFDHLRGARWLAPAAAAP